ncbi:MAG TPA: 3-deoxy-D-manno-octulosonic acid transferase [Acidisarcina sp.]|nr:3-deoxy-D-manno-octulosonic acid transferase [Acidisarcina sp.]
MLLFLYSAALYLTLLVTAPFWLFKIATTEKYRYGLAERLGRLPRRVLDARGAQPVIWVHAVSVGELLAASRLIEELSVRAKGYRVLVSTTTRTGQELARARFGEDRVFYFPLDFRWVVQRYLRAVRPALVVLLETEFWPNFLAACREAHIPVAVINARISDRSYPRYVRLRVLWRQILSGIVLALAQTEEDVSRLIAIGVPEQRVRLGGNLKFDVRTAQPAEVTTALRSHIPAGGEVLVAGSTLDGEEKMMLEAWPQVVAAVPNSRMVLAPRHPARFATVAALLQRSGIWWARRSEWLGAPCDLPPGAVFLLDSIGELASVYSLATLAFVGGSLVPAGGHNPLEPAQYAVPVVMGLHYTNFRAIVETLRVEEALQIVSREDLADSLIERLSRREETALMGARAQHIFERESGATERAIEALRNLLLEANR